MLRQRYTRGFTVIELLVIIIVIGILASIVSISYSRSLALSRDTKRVADLEAIADSITAYRLRFGDHVQAASCASGSSGSGNGWFNYTNGTTYTKDILSCLTDNGYLNKSYVDPFGCGTTTSATAHATGGYTCRKAGYAYMKSTCTVSGQTVTVIMARLELSGNVADLQGANGICSSDSWATSYGMNYMVKVE